MKTLTITSKTTEDGCRILDTDNVIAEAVNAARPIKGQKRGGMPRFMVKIDSLDLKLNTVAALEKELQNCSAGQVKVFRNAGFGATIDFN